MMRLAGSLCVACLACAGTPKRTAQLPFVAVEVTEDGDELAIPNTGLTEVDVNSVIELRLNEPVLRPAMQQASAVDPRELERLGARTTKLRAAMTAQKAALERMEHYLQSPPPPERVAEAAKALAALEEQSLDALEALYSDAEVEAILSAGVHGAYQKAMAAIDREIAATVAAIAAIEAPLQRSRFRVLASLQTRAGPIPQHLDGYDSLAAGSPQLIDKIAWTQPRELADARALVQQHKDLRGVVEHVGDLLESRAKELLEKLTASGDRLVELRRIAETWTTAPWRTLEQAKALGAAATSLQLSAAAIADACTPALAALPQLSHSPRRAALALVDPGSPLRRCIAQLEQDEQKLRDAATALATEASELIEAAHADAALAAKLEHESLADITAVGLRAGQQSADDIVQFWRSIQPFFGPAEAILSAPALVAGEHTIDRPYGALQDTAIDLTRSARAAGDTLHWRAAVIQDGLEARAWSSPTMRVVSTGVRLDVSAAVIFVKPFEEQPRDDSFPAAAAVTAAFHYRIERSSGENSAGGSWNFLNPGLGIHIAYLDLGASRVNADDEVESDDPSNEIGVGGLVQLFGDVLTAGIGYDLQAARSYWFFGFGLKTLTDLGVTVPGAQ